MNMAEDISNLLPIEYSYQCFLEYKKEMHGHSWQCVDKEKWGLIENGELIPFQSRVEVVEAILNGIFPKPRLRNKISKNWELFNWFKSTKEEKLLCPEEISVLLNTVVTKELPVKEHFEVLISICDGPTTTNIRSLPNLIPGWLFSSLEVDQYIADILFVLNCNKLKKLKETRKKEAFRDRIRFIRSLHKYKITDICTEDPKLCIQLQDNVKIVNYMRGQVCGCLPIPGPAPKPLFFENKVREPDLVCTPEVIVRSPVIYNALKELSHIWQDTFSRTVLISAPPGSGKEDLSRSIPYGNGRPEANLKTISMADGNADSLQRRLYGVGGPGKTLQKGLIAQAEGSAIFLDEIHQPGPAQEQSIARSNLLRTLEAGEYFAVDDSTPQKIENTLFVMATSIPLKDLKDYHPRDFWTRMNYAIEIPHPLSYAAFNVGDPTMSELVSKFFNHFWWARIEGYYGMEPVFENPTEDILSDSQRILVFWQVHSMTKIMGFKCRSASDFDLVPIEDKSSENYPYRFAEEFNKCLSTQSNIQEVRDFSVRGIRNMVTRLFSIAASDVVRGQTPWKIPGQFITDIDESFQEISKVADLSR